jgi:cytochrome c
MHTAIMRFPLPLPLVRERRSRRAGSVVAAALALLACTPTTTTTPARAPAPATTVHASAPAPEPSRFQQDVLLQGVFDEPTEIAVAHDGRVFIVERHGTMSVYDPATRAQRVITRFVVNDTAENGLIGIALDPHFDTNHWIYVNRTVGWSHRLARFTLAGDSLRDEKTMLEVKIDKGCCHTGGSIAFDRDGRLFVSYGDNTNPFVAGDYAPIDPTPGKSQADALRSSGNTQDLRGKILRIVPTPDGKYTIPDGNLFKDPKDGRPEIYVMGDRNPYRISVDQHTGWLYWGEVGPDARKDSELGPEGFDEVNQAKHAGNFGWPMFIADNRAYRNYDYTKKQLFGFFDPAHPVNASPNNTGAKVLPPPQPALIYYPYERSAKFPLVGEGGRTAMAGPVYHYADFAGSDVRLPEYYDGKLIHYDWMRGWMMATTLSPEGDFVRMEPFLPQFTFDHPVDVELGSDGSLYVLEYGTYWNAANANARLSRITYHPGNRPPVARIVASRTIGAAPLTVELSADSSFDRDPGDSVRFSWTIPGAGERQGAHVTQTFTSPGRQHVRLRVRDAHGAESEAGTDILVGNTPPSVTIGVDGNRSFYWSDGATVAYDVHVADREDGILGRGVDPARVVVTMSYGPIGAAAAAAPGSADAQSASVPEGLALIRKSDCLACHGIDNASVGPSYTAVAQRYAAHPEARVQLVTKIAAGGTGVWGDRVMPPHPNVSEEDRRAMVAYILSLASNRLPPRGRVTLAPHPEAPGGAYRITAAYADVPRNGIGPLADTAVVVIRPPRVLAATGTALHAIGIGKGVGADGTTHMLTTAYADSSWLSLGRLDLTGVGRVTVELRQARNPHSFTIELRDGGPAGAVLARADARASGTAWTTATIPVTAQGEYQLYLVLRSPDRQIEQFDPMVTIDGLRFEKR